MEKFSDISDRIKTKAKKIFLKINKLVKRNQKFIIAFFCALFICVIAIIVIRIFINKGANETNMLTESANEVLGVEEEQIKEIVEVPIEKDKYTELNRFFAKYFIALAECDEEIIISSRTETDDLELIKILKRNEFVESYQNLACYTKPGPFDNTYVCYVYYEIKFPDLDILVPGLSSMYVIQKEDKYYLECSANEKKVEEYLISITKQEDVVDLFRKVQVQYNDLIAGDLNVELYLAELPDKIKIEVAKELAKINIERAEAIEEEVIETSDSGADNVAPLEEVVIETVKATTTVNVRGSDSTTAEKVGKVQAGDMMTCVETLNNGWSKILYENKEAFIKSEYLEVIEKKVVEAGMAAAGTMVKTTDNVRVRKEPSINAECLGAALAGESFELLENLDNGWSKISFNGAEAYIKSDYLS